MNDRINTLERTTLNTDSFVTIAERVPTTDEITQLEECWVQNPVERIASQLEELAVLYDGRIDRLTDYDFLGRNHQFDVFATRDADGNHLEEVYTIYSVYSAQHGYTRSYEVTILDGADEMYTLSIKKGELSIRTTRGGTRTEVINTAERDTYVTDFLHRSLIATVRTTDRPFQDRMDADADALAKLEQRLYQGPRRVDAVGN